MKKKPETDITLLSEVTRSFSKYRSKLNGDLPKYPSDLKDLAVAALGAGHTRVAVAKASKVSLITLTDWRKQKSKNAIHFAKPREFAVVDEPKACLAPSAAIQIYFPSGVRMELPFGAMTPSFLSGLGALWC